MSTDAEQAIPLLHTCPQCGTLLDVSAVEPFTNVQCPTCDALMRVRKQFDQFELLEYLAAGGMGTVYKARDVNLNRVVALKLLRKEYSADADYIAKLETEAQITASVAHPFVVKVFSFGCDQGVYYIAMELVDKGSLDDLMTLQGRIAEAQVLEIGLQVAQGLRAAYRVGLIHRDVKPGNILFADAHTAKIVDFGLALPLEKAKEGEAEVWGTPYYVAPEKLNHEPEDFRSDIYSLGGTLFHALSGRPPFEAANASLVALKHLKSQVVSLQAFAPDASSPTAYVINRTLARNPEDRYQSYDELIEHLEYARSQLLGTAGKPRQPKARVVVEDEKQQSAFGYIMMAMIAFTLLMGLLLWYYKDSIISRRTSGEDLARQQMEHSLTTVEQTLAHARAKMVAGDAEAALKMLRTLEGLPNLPEDSKVWISLHACIAQLAAGRLDQGGDILSKLIAGRIYQSEDRAAEEHMRQFLRTLTAFPGGKSGAAIKRWSMEGFEPVGFLIIGLKEWDSARFDSASTLFQRFLAVKPSGTWAWINDFRPFAQAYREDFAVYKGLKAEIGFADSPEKKLAVARKISGVKAKLKRPGKLREELASLEATLSQPAQ
ncbi:MAG: serine/threonine-protein kinase [Verrucomicrobia bacterium]|nr:serine/threonine-protein kinase [Verrucomicrobiota bacterium]